MSSIPQSQKDSTTSQVGDHQQHHGSSLNPPQNATRNYLLDPGVMDNNGRLQRWPVHVQHFPQQWHVQATTSHMHASRSSDYAQPPADFDINVYPAGPRYTGKPKTSEKIGRTSKSIGKFALQAIDNAIVFATRVSILTDAIVKAVACLFDRLTSHRRDSSAVPRADLRLQQSPTDAMLVYSPLRPGSEPVWCLQTSSVPVSMHQVQVAPGARLYRDLKGAEDLPEGGNTLTFELI